MPAPDLIPDNHLDDVPHRTFINEYWKNRVVLDAVRKTQYIQIIDFMSIELPFNHKGSHRDAVHLDSSKVKGLLSDAIMNAIFSGEDSTIR